MAREFVIIMNRRRWSWLPLLKVETRFSFTCEYYEACDKLAGVRDLIPSNWKLSLGRIEPDGSLYVFD